MKAGEQRDVPVTFPAEYPAEHLAGKAATFAVTVKDVKERVLPELDDEFAKSVSEFDTLAELDADLHARFLEAITEEGNRVFRSTVLDDLAGQLSTELPEAAGALADGRHDAKHDRVAVGAGHGDVRLPADDGTECR